MSKSEWLKVRIHKTGIAVNDQLLLILYSSNGPLSIKSIKTIAIEIGAKDVYRNRNISAKLISCGKKACRIPEGWELTDTGRSHVETVFDITANRRSKKAAEDIRAMLDSVKTEDSRAFFDEAIACMEHGLYRAAIVLSWVGTISVLYDFIVRNHLHSFNTEASARDAKWKHAKTVDDLALMKESDFLDIISKLSHIGKNVKNELKKCLDTRNGCGHPNSLKVSEATAAAHIEILVLNIFRNDTFFI